MDQKIYDILRVALLTIVITQGMSLLFKLVPHKSKELTISMGRRDYYLIDRRPFYSVPYHIGFNYTVLDSKPFYFRQDIEITPRSFVWRLFEKISTAAYFWLVYFMVITLNNKARIFILPFVIMKILLVFEYILSYNSPWFLLGSFKIGLTHFFIIFTFMVLGRIIYLREYV